MGDNAKNDRVILPQLLVRSKNGVELFPVLNPTSVDTEEKLKKYKEGADASTRVLTEQCTLHVFSSDGSKLLLLRPSVGLVLMNNVNGYLNLDSRLQESQISTLNKKVIPGCPHLAYFSPQSNFIVTWERPVKPKDGSNPANNLKVWDANSQSESGEMVLLLSLFSKPLPQKLPSLNPAGVGGEQYSVLQFTHDEAFLCHLVSNEIQMYNTKSLQTRKVAFKVRCPNISSFSLAPKNVNFTKSNQYLLSTFVPEVKGKPARVALHEIKTQSLDDNLFIENVLTSKSFFQTESVNIKWSPYGNSALVQTQNTVDATGESYYGSSSLHLLLTYPKPDSIQVPIPGKGNGVVHDVAWCPTSATSSATPCFALLSGKMPAMGSLHHGSTGDPSFLFGEAHRNIVSWSPHGRFLCLAGFGNLAGGMDFWDRNKLKKIPRYHPGESEPIAESEIRAHCAVGYGWSPDSRLFFVSTTSPRMNVDNAIRLYKYNGYGPFDQFSKCVAWNNESYDPNKLTSVEFVPTPMTNYPDRPQSPAPKKKQNGSLGNNVSQIRPSVISNNTNTKSAAKPSAGRYVPPSARGKSMGGGSLAERMRMERAGSTAQAGKVGKSLSKSFGQNSNKRVIPGMAPVNDKTTKSKSALRRERVRLNKEKAKEEEAVDAAKKEAPPVPVDPEKRSKKIKKILKQIDELKAKNQKDLNDDQRKKILTEAALRKELSELAL